VIVLCNRETAGPFEAVLAKLQQHGAIIGVGEATAGRTGFYEKSDHHTWILHGEIRPDEATSLVGTGFQPRIQLEINSEENYLSYHLYEAGTTIEQLLSQKNTMPNNEAMEVEGVLIKPDRILQRGVDIIAALQILQQQPEL
jgi:sulfur carrier protein ThiS